MAINQEQKECPQIYNMPGTISSSNFDIVSRRVHRLCALCKMQLACPLKDETPGFH